MEDDNRENGSTPARRPRRRAPAKKKPGTAPTRRKPASRAKKAAPEQAVAVAAPALETMLRGFADKAAEARASLASISGEGVQSARRALGQASAASKKTIDRLAREWQRMDTKKRAQFIAALLAALAAASAPIIRASRKKR